MTDTSGVKPTPRALLTARAEMANINQLVDELARQNRVAWFAFAELCEAVSVAVSEAADLIAAGREADAQDALGRILTSIESGADPVRRAAPSREQEHAD